MNALEKGLGLLDGLFLCDLAAWERCKNEYQERTKQHAVDHVTTQD
jgi:hypothetical protein